MANARRHTTFKPHDFFSHEFGPFSLWIEELSGPSTRNGRVTCPLCPPLAATACLPFPGDNLGKGFEDEIVLEATSALPPAELI